MPETISDVDEGYAATPPAHTTDPNSASIAERFARHKDDAPTKPSGSRWGLPDGPIVAEPKPEPKKSDEKPVSSPVNGQPVADASKDGKASDALVQEDEIERLSPEGPESGRAWKTLKSEYKKAKAELKAKQDEIKALQSQAKEPQTPAELAEVQRQLEMARKERDDISTVLKTALYQHSPEFQARFQGRRDALLALAKETLPADTYAKAAEIFKLASGDYRDGLLTELGADLPRATQARLDALALEFDKVSMEYKAEMAEGAKRYESWQKGQQEATKRKLDQYNTLFNQRLARIQDPKSGDGLDVYARTDDPKAQQEVTEMIDVARRAWSGSMPEDQLVTLQLWGAALPNYIKRMATVTKQRDDALTELQALKGATPGVGKPREQTPGKSDEGPREGESMAQYLARANPSGRIPR